MGQEFDRTYWEDHYRSHGRGPGTGAPPNPHLVAQVSGLAPGRALDAGAGTGAEARWLAGQGWQVTAADISRSALDAARERTDPVTAERITWVRADLTEEDPGSGFDLVCSHYAHPAGDPRVLFSRLASAVAPGGLLFIVGHDRTGDHRHDGSLEHTRVSADRIAQSLDGGEWEVLVNASRSRETARSGHRAPLHDSVLAARRR